MDRTLIINFFLTGRNNSKNSPMCSEENSENMQAVKAKSPLEVFEFPEPPKEPPIGPLNESPKYVGPLKQPLKDPPIKPLRKPQG